ncbi:MAG: ParB N-terminal domain-containing protein [Thermoguttaceae bacterium]|nr:ParB N-terminal domain-containing protein [Thermoguttaceae bacterium]
MLIKDRIKELRRVPASQLIPNPKNWRTHPEKQKNAIQGVLAEIGYADALIARELPDGSLMLLDGHLRAETTPNQEVPVLVLDLDEAEADKLLATLDPISAMAGKSDELYADLIAEMETSSAAVRELLDQTLGTTEDLEAALPQTEAVIPTLFQIVIDCGSEERQEELYERFREEGLKCRLLNL